MRETPIRFQVVRFGQAHGGCGRLCVLAVLVVLCVLVPFAYASPPDPLWIRGIYDAADTDDAILAATSLDNRVEEEPGVGRPAWMVEDTVLAVGSIVCSADSRKAQSRAPPES